LTSYRNYRSSRGANARSSGGGTALYVLMFFAASAVIIGGVIAFQRQQNRTDTNATVTIEHSGGAGYSDNHYEDLGYKPNPKPTTTPVVRHETPPKPPRDNGGDYQFIGDAKYKKYHRPGCRYVGHIQDGYRVRLASAEDARNKGYIPCKVCRPALALRAERTAPTDPTVKPVPRPQPKPEKPVKLVVKDVNVPFKFEIIKNEPETYRGVVQVHVTVEVLKPLQRGDILLLSRKLVAAVTREREVNAVSIFMRSKKNRRSGIRWICMAEWAPYGNLTRASEVNTGDYANHQFRIYQMGFFTP